MNRLAAKLIALLMVLGMIAQGAALAQDADLLPAPDFTPLAENPVLSRGALEDWDSDCGTIYAPQVIEHDGLFHLFYTGSCQRGGRPSAIGYATSPDGLAWTKSASNPILTPDASGYDAMCVSAGVPFVEGDTWTLYYAANSQPCAGPGQHVGRATATDPNGPWQRDDSPVLETGSAGAWDAGFIMPQVVLRSGDGYVLYYTAGEDYLVPLPRFVGMATSPDGIHWTKYDDPATTAAPYAESDPVMMVQADGTTAPLTGWAFDVLKTDDGWEMFFSSTCPQATDQTCPGFIALAYSADGLHWQPYTAPEQQALTSAMVDQAWAAHCICYPSVVRQGAQYWLYFSGCADAMNDCQIGLATGTVSWHE